MGQKVFKKFGFNDVKSPENLFCDIQIVEKCFICGVLQNLSEKFPLLGPKFSSKNFSYIPMNLTRRGASFKYPYKYIFNNDFLAKNKSFLKASDFHFLI